MERAHSSCWLLVWGLLYCQRPLTHFSPLIGSMIGTGLRAVFLPWPSQTLINVAAQIISGFISFGSLHIHTTRFEPWQWYDQVQRLTHALVMTSSRLMIITGTLTLLTAIAFLWAYLRSYDHFVHSGIHSFLFPDSPTDAWFLTEDERAKAVRRIKVRNNNYSGMLALSINNEGKPNGGWEQALQKGAVGTVHLP